MWSRYLDLILYKTYADLRAEAARTYLGFLWWVFEPIMYMSVFYLIFGLLMNRGPEDFVPFLLVGLSIWQWFKSCLSHGGVSIYNGRLLMRQVHLPKVLFPIILILTDSVKFVFILSLLLVFLWSQGYGPSLTYLALPLVLGTQLLFITGCVLLLAAIIPFLPDLRFVVENLLQAVFFVSGIFFEADKVVPEEYKFYYYLNPMATLIEDYRDILMYQSWPDWSGLALLCLISLGFIGMGHWLIGRFEYLYPRIG